MAEWQTKTSRVAYENPWIIVHEDEVVTPDGKDGLYGVVSSKSDAVFVVPVDVDGYTYIVQQKPYTTRELAWGCVAGRTDGEPVEIAAKRELLEEAGIRAAKIAILSEARTSTGITTFRSTICLAENLTPDMTAFDSAEIETVKKLPLTEAIDMITTGEIANTESIAALFLAREYLEKQVKK